MNTKMTTRNTCKNEINWKIIESYFEGKTFGTTSSSSN